jgi:hypothetical protein
MESAVLLENGAVRMVELVVEVMQRDAVALKESICITLATR